MLAKNNETLKRITRRYELFGSNTVTALWEWAMLTTCASLVDKNNVEQMLRDIGEQIRKERYAYDVLLAGYHQMQRDNDDLRQLSLFGFDS